MADIDLGNSATNIINITIENHNYEGDTRNSENTVSRQLSNAQVEESHRSVPGEGSHLCEMLNPSASHLSSEENQSEFDFTELDISPDQKSSEPSSSNLSNLCQKYKTQAISYPLMKPAQKLHEDRPITEISDLSLDTDRPLPIEDCYQKAKRYFDQAKYEKSL